MIRENLPLSSNLLTCRFNTGAQRKGRWQKWLLQSLRTTHSPLLPFLYSLQCNIRLKYQEHSTFSNVIYFCGCPTIDHWKWDKASFLRQKIVWFWEHFQTTRVRLGQQVRALRRFDRLATDIQHCVFTGVSKTIVWKGSLLTTKLSKFWGNWITTHYVLYFKNLRWKEMLLGGTFCHTQCICQDLVLYYQK